MHFLAQYSYSYSRPFLEPLPIWRYWYLLLLPLCGAVAVVYKSIKCNLMSQVFRQSAVIVGWILLSFGAAAVALAMVVKFIEMRGDR